MPVFQKTTFYRMFSLFLTSMFLATCSISGSSGVDTGDGGRPTLPETASGTIAFVDVNVVSMESERVLQRQTVIVEDGWITAIGAVDEVALPEGALEIDGRGTYVMPGLADMHVHLIDSKDLFLFLANGITTIRIMWGFDDVLTWRDQVAEGITLGPTVYAASPGLDGPPGFWPGTVVVRNAQEGRAAVAAQKAAGYDFIKVYSSLSLNAYDAILGAAAQEGIRVVGHQPNSVSLEHLIASGGHESIAHVAGFRRSLINNPALATAMRDANVWSGPTITVQMRTLAQANDWRNSSIWRYLSPELRGWMQNSQAQPIGAAPQSFHRERNQALRILRDAGAGMLLGTDNGIRVVLPGYSIHEELVHLSEAGLTPFEILRAGTSDAARFLGTSDFEGTVAVGNLANLLVLHANPLEDVRHVSQQAGIMLKGQWFSASKIQEMLEERAAAYEANSN